MSQHNSSTLFIQERQAFKTYRLQAPLSSSTAALGMGREFSAATAPHRFSSQPQRSKLLFRTRFQTHCCKMPHAELLLLSWCDGKGGTRDQQVGL